MTLRTLGAHEGFFPLSLSSPTQSINPGTEVQIIEKKRLLKRRSWATRAGDLRPAFTPMRARQGKEPPPPPRGARLWEGAGPRGTGMLAVVQREPAVRVSVRESVRVSVRESVRGRGEGNLLRVNSSHSRRA